MFKRNDNFSRPLILLVKKSLDRFYLVNKVFIFWHPNLKKF